MERQGIRTAAVRGYELAADRGPSKLPRHAGRVHCDHRRSDAARILIGRSRARAQWRERARSRGAPCKDELHN